MNNEERRFGGLARLYGAAGAQRIHQARVAVVGIGGVGSWAVETLARSYVGQLVLIDFDHISDSNINRQIHALDNTVGMAKVLAMQERIAHINPDCQVQAIDEFATAENWPHLLGGPVDAVIDACDDIRAKIMLAHWARQHKTPFITVGAAGGKRQAHRVHIDDLQNTNHDPLLAKLRYQLRKHHNAPRTGRMHVACVYSEEPITAPQSDDAQCSTDGSLNCHGYGSVASVTATFGHCAAGWVLEKLTQIPKL